MAGQWFPLGAQVSSTDKTYHHDITEILFQVSLDIITLSKYFFLVYDVRCIFQLRHRSPLHGKESSGGSTECNEMQSVCLWRIRQFVCWTLQVSFCVFCCYFYIQLNDELRIFKRNFLENAPSEYKAHHYKRKCNIELKKKFHINRICHR